MELVNVDKPNEYIMRAIRINRLAIGFGWSTIKGDFWHPKGKREVTGKVRIGKMKTNFVSHYGIYIYRLALVILWKDKVTI